MTKDNIIRLLNSSNDDDQILGCVLAVEHLGENWCRQNFKPRSDINESRYKSKLGLILEFDYINIFIGPNYIEYLAHRNDHRLYSYQKINFKTNDKLKTTSESIS